jgi:hypothetical protein
MKKLAAFDLVILGYLAIVSLIVLVCRPEGGLIYLAYHAAVAVLMGLVIYAQHRFDGRFWTFCRSWYIVPVVAGAFREMHYLIPLVHPFDDHHYDRVLQSLDARWFGDVDGFFLSGWPPAIVDLLHLCYWFYFISLLIPGGFLYARKEWAKLREFTTAAMLGLLISYLGYFLVPAIGPHHFFHPRPASLDGWILGGPMHQMILEAEWRMPDAFPSGHALMSMLVIAMSWRLHRPSFWIVVGPSAGCVLATVALRYHYVVDVAASAALLPAVLWGAIAFSRLRERTGDASPKQP